ncbi:MAG: hypothetical protein JW918_03035, partial [Anaerolineae bacterium]|nr:hypothetical protein [Anaerolineae bacterium]
MQIYDPDRAGGSTGRRRVDAGHGRPGADRRAVRSLVVHDGRRGSVQPGGSYWLGGTAGQLDAGSTLAGGTFELVGGVWSFQEGNPTAVALASFSATPQGSGVLLRWETAMEIDNVGFNLYRAPSPEGSWERLNESLIPSQAPGSVFGATYTWFDEDVEAGITYYYKLEDVEVGGGHAFHGPISVQPGGPTAVVLQVFSTNGVFGGILLVVGLAACLGGAALLRRR